MFMCSYACFHITVLLQPFMVVAARDNWLSTYLSWTRR
jgi:hypothetical protein